MPDIPKVAAVDSNHIVATWSRSVIAVWRNVTTADAVHAMRDTIQALGKRHPGGVTLLQLVEAHAVMPDSAARAALTDMLNTSRNVVKYSAVVYEGEGFKAAAVRGIVTSLTMLAKPPFPHRIFSTVDTAAVWQTSEMRLNMSLDVSQELYRTTVNGVRDLIALTAQQSA